MTPRSYDMTQRAAARKATRERIVEATAKLHAERGVLGTSWQDIAEEADVSVSTVYGHFPSLDDLLPACGQLVMSRIRPPTSDSADDILGEAADTRERLSRVADELFSFYERGGAHIEVDIRERELPGMREWEESQRATVAALVRAALVAEGATRKTVNVISAFFDLATYKSLRTRGVDKNEAIETVVTVALALLPKSTSPTQTGGA
jgi:AcrR family transcriptional regulator